MAVGRTAPGGNLAVGQHPVDEEEEQDAGEEGDRAAANAVLRKRKTTLSVWPKKTQERTVRWPAVRATEAMASAPTAKARPSETSLVVEVGAVLATPQTLLSATSSGRKTPVELTSSMMTEKSCAPLWGWARSCMLRMTKSWPAGRKSASCRRRPAPWCGVEDVAA